MKLCLPKGTKDILPDQIHLWQKAERVFAEVCEQYGFSEIRIPTFEHTDVFERGVGNATDVVRKEMYTFEDKGGRSITLRPEGTAGVVRSFIENGMGSLPSPVKLFYNITAFRYEKMQKGRYREFHQFGVEAFGSSGPEIDAEIISLLCTFFERVGIAQTRLCINSIGCPACRPTYHVALKDYFADKVSDMCEDCKARYDINPQRMIDCKEERCKPFVANAPRQIEYLCSDCRTHLSGLEKCLSSLDINYKIDTSIVRGLDYYTRTVFEFVSDHVGTQGTICGGGRYDRLVETMGGHSVPGIGFAMGVERFLMEAASQGVSLAERVPVNLCLVHMSESAYDQVFRLAHRLRRAGIACEVDLMGRSFRAQMKYANKLGIPYMMVIGDDEIASGMAKIKRMIDGIEVEVRLDDLPEQASIFMNESTKEN